MAQYPQFIDNKRIILAETLRTIAPHYSVLRIATGYWDLLGTLELIDRIKDYDKIQLLIGRSPYQIIFRESIIFQWMMKIYSPIHMLNPI